MVQIMTPAIARYLLIMAKKKREDARYGYNWSIRNHREMRKRQAGLDGWNKEAWLHAGDDSAVTRRNCRRRLKTIRGAVADLRKIAKAKP
jgi:uncharacterized protein CbrC (UPF0167 family)